MASYLHETLVAMFRHRPALAAELLSQQLGLAVPAHDEVRLGSAEVIELRPAAHRADAVVLAEDHTGPVFAVNIEVQLRPDEDKTWVAGVPHRRAPRPPLPRRAARGVRRRRHRTVGRGTDRPGRWIVPDSPDGSRARGHPILDDPMAASAAPELAVLSALAHVRDDGPFEVLDALSVALNHTPVQQAVDYVRLVLAALPEMARRHLEELMAAETFHYESEFTRSLEARGEARGRAATLLTVLAARGLAVDEESRARITECIDVEQLGTWAERAVTADSVADLFT